MSTKIWTDEAEQRLLQLKQQEQYPLSAVASVLTAEFGHEFTLEAVRSKYSRLAGKRSSKKKSSPQSASESPSTYDVVRLSDEQQQFAVKLYVDGCSTRDIATILCRKFDLKLTPKDVQQQIDLVRESAHKETTAAPLADLEDPDTIQTLVDGKDKHELLNYLMRAQDVMESFDTIKDEAAVRIPSDVSWQLVVFAGDWHIGAQKVNIRRLVHETELIAKTPNCWYVFVGDATDNFIAGGKIKGGQHEQIVPPHIARVAASALFDILGESLLAVATGCHDDWSIQVDDFNLIEEIAKKQNCAYLGFGGKVNLHVGDIMYQLTAMHKYRMNSTLNIDHACRRYLQMEDMDNDIVAVAHNHTPFIGLEQIQDRPRVLIRTAAYKSLDHFARKLMFKDGSRSQPLEDKIFFPCVLLNTQQKMMRIAYSIPEGIGLLQFLNSITPEEYAELYGDYQESA